MNNNEKTPSRVCTGIWIPLQIWEDERLDCFEKCLFAEIYVLDGDDHCYASNDYLCKFLKVNLRTLQRGLAKLISIGLIKYLNSDGRHRIIRSNIKITYDKFDTPDMTSLHDLKSSHDKFVTPDMTNLVNQSHRHSQEREIIVENIEERKNTLYILPTVETESVKIPTTNKNFTLEGMGSAEYLLQKILVYYPNIKSGKMDLWARDMDLLHRVDKRSWDEIKSVIDWIFQDSFWCSKVLSPAKLRKHWDTIYAKMKPPKLAPTQFEVNKQDAWNAQSRLQELGRAKIIIVGNDRVFHAENRESLPFNMNPQEFQKALCKLFNLRIVNE